MYGRRNQPVELQPVNPRKRERSEAPQGRGDMAQQGFERLSSADRETGARQPIGGTPVWPAYREEN